MANGGYRSFVQLILRALSSSRANAPAEPVTPYVVVRGSEADKAEMLVNAKREVAKFVAMNGG